MEGAQDVELLDPLGTVGFMTVASVPPLSSATGADTQPMGMNMSGLQRAGGQELTEGGVSARLYTGIVRRGELSGTRVVLKAYPQDKSAEADAMAANEVALHCSLQPPAAPFEHPHICKLLGGFAVEDGASRGEQWLVFRNDGTISAAAYAAKAAEATASGRSVGEGEMFDRLDPAKPLARRRAFVIELLRQCLEGMTYMHARQRLHQSLGPSSVVLRRIEERDYRQMEARLRDLAFGVDVSDAGMYDGATLGEIWDRGVISAGESPLKKLASGLWARAQRDGAYTVIERRNYGIADDIYAAGLLVAYMCFVPFCEPGSIDGPALQRLLESTFRLDVAAARDFCEADDRWRHAVALLDVGGGAGWELIQAMLNPNWRLRPTAQSCLNHPFLTGAAFGTQSK
ncbi:hypothetical protein WJX72_000643 [[Myrmecia] bisecta]|uniref:Protein kinase domain-containing protein n=1 Tax=[Myrmecia] bisecta TaxID=41462 RepID=A0AAW1R463_9CHLO